jgi:hypothetical protein
MAGALVKNTSDLVVDGQGPAEDHKRALEVVLARRFEPKLDVQGRPVSLLPQAGDGA